MIELAGELICVSPQEADVVRAYLPDHVALTREEEGCVLFEVLPVGGGVWTVHELFTDMKAFEAHQARVQASEWGRATAAIRRNYDVREVADPVEPAAQHVHDHPHEHDHAHHPHGGDAG